MATLKSARAYTSSFRGPRQHLRRVGIKLPKRSTTFLAPPGYPLSARTTRISRHPVLTLTNPNPTPTCRCCRLLRRPPPHHPASFVAFLASGAYLTNLPQTLPLPPKGFPAVPLAPLSAALPPRDRPRRRLGRVQGGARAPPGRHRPGRGRPQQVKVNVRVACLLRPSLGCAS